MEGLDLLKKDWQKNGNKFSQYTDSDLYKMLHKKSSSTVRWILIISILEVALWTFVSFFNNDDYLNKTEYSGIADYITAFNFFNYAVVVIFIILFYRNYVSISTTGSTKNLMHSILKTRKTVKWYVGYNLFMIAVTLILGFLIALNYSPELTDLQSKLDGNSGLTLVLVVAFILFLGLCILLFWLFYRLLYGVLLKRLLANYKELEKIETAD